jgi:hypothetical protein
MLRNQELKLKMQQSVDEWMLSGVSQREWCLGNGIGLSKFKYWVGKLGSLGKETKRKKSVKKIQSNNFIPIKISAPQIPLQEDRQLIEICYPNGVKVNCPSEIKTELLTTLLTIH